MAIPTPHIEAKQGDFAKTVLMPGDPKRAEYIAKTYLTDCVLVNDVRGVKGYTGYYKGKRVSVIRGDKEIPALVRGTDDDLRLLVEYDDGTKEALGAGEVSIRL